MLISVIIPTFNRAGMVCRSIDSVLNQSYKNLEVLVVDDHSTDDTLFWLRKYKDPRLKVISLEKNSGVAAARNRGVKESQSDWICFLDSDDVWRKHKLSEQLRFHDKNRSILISQTDDVWLRNSTFANKMKKHETREGHIFQESLKLCLICCSSVMINKAFFWERGGFDEKLPTCEDYDLWLKLSCTHEIGFVPKKLVTKFGGHGDQLSKTYEAMDRYRILSLENLLQTKLLTSRQEDWTRRELEFKKQVFEKGLSKRKNHETF